MTLQQFTPKRGSNRPRGTAALEARLRKEATAMITDHGGRGKPLDGKSEACKKGHWKPGQSGNPKGGSTINKEWRDRLREACAGEDGGKSAIEWLIERFRDPSDKKLQLQAIELSMAYAWGKPTQMIGMDSEAPFVVRIDVL